MEALRPISIAGSLSDHCDLPHNPDLIVANDTLQFYQLAMMIRRRILLITAFALLGAAATYAMAVSLQRYTAKALILVEPQPGRAVSAEANGVLPADEQTVIETHIMTLTSDANLRSVLQELVASKVVDPTDFSDLQFQRNLKASQQLHSRVIAVTFTSKSAQEAMLVANRVAQGYVEQLRNRKRDSIEHQRLDIQNTIEDIHKKLDRLIGSRPPTDVKEVEVVNLNRRLSELNILESALTRESDTESYRQTSDSGVSLLSAATLPKRPSTGRPGLLMVPAAVAFGILGVFMALVLERADRGLRSEQEVNAVLGMPCFGMVPWVRCPLDARELTKRWLRRDGVDPYSEAIRRILFAHVVGSDAATVVLVTSVLPQEGKSTFAFGLADGAARLGRKALLVEIDWRNPRRSKQNEKGPGLLDALAGEQMDEPQPMTIRGSGFDRIGIGVARDPTTLMANGRLARYLDKRRASYDLVIIDGPSLHGGAEAPMLASMCDKILLVIHWGKTSRDLARSALARISPIVTRRRPLSNSIGTVITQVSLRRHALYRFGDSAEALSRFDGPAWG